MQSLPLCTSYPRSAGEQYSSRSKDYCIVGEGGRSLKNNTAYKCKKSAINSEYLKVVLPSTHSHPPTLR
eukprot:scaffold6916_cov125-Skeletonema_dohrnii-CCMP3373.AAC.2